MMSGIRGKDTQPELVLRRGLFSRGIRFRLHAASLPGRPDIVIRKYQTAVLVHGCFWHAHEGCQYFRLPGENRQFWAEKLGGNKERDARFVVALRAAGWRVAVVWECATRSAPDAALDAVCAFLKGNQAYLEISGAKASGRLKLLSAGPNCSSGTRARSGVVNSRGRRDRPPRQQAGGRIPAKRGQKPMQKGIPTPTTS